MCIRDRHYTDRFDLCSRGKQKSGQSKCIVTFEQRLYVKANDVVIQNNGEHGTLSNVVVRSGGFHLLMSFSGSIGFLMADSVDLQNYDQLYTSKYYKNKTKILPQNTCFCRKICTIISVACTVNVKSQYYIFGNIIRNASSVRFNPLFRSLIARNPLD